MHVNRNLILKINNAFLQTVGYLHACCIAEKFGGGKFGEFGKSSLIYQTKTIQISTYN